MKTLIILSVILLNLLSSCGEKSQKRAKEDDLEVSITLDQTTKNTSCIYTIDSLKQIIKNISSTDYDLIVITLKGLPEYQNALFLTPKENQEYLELVQKNAEKFKIKQQYWNHSDKNWASVDDTTQFKGGMFKDCKIVFDTTQTIKPLLVLTQSFMHEYKDKRTKDEKTNIHLEVYNYYYIPKLKIGYIIVNNKIFFTGRLIHDTYKSDYDVLDGEIRTGFQTYRK